MRHSWCNRLNLSSKGDGSPKSAAVIPPSLVLALGLVLTACGGDESEPAVAGGASDGDFLTDDIRLIIPYDAGGGGDAYARAVADSMEEFLPDGINVVPENLTPFVEGLGTLYRADPDGHTIGYMPMPAAVGTEIELGDAIPWETQNFSLLGSIESNGYALFVAGDSEYETLEDLQNAEGLSAMATDPGSGAALAEGVAITGLGLDAQTTYGAETSTEIFTALLRGEVDFTVHGILDNPGAVESGDFRPLLFLGTDDQRTEGVEWVQDLQDWEDLDQPDLVGAVSEYRIFAGPPDLPEDQLQYLQDIFEQAVNGENMAEWSEESGRPLLPQTAEETQDIVEQQSRAMAELIPQISSDTD